MNLLTKEQNENILDVEVEEVEYVVDFVDTDSDDSESTSVDVLGEKELESQLIADVKTDIQQMLSLVNRDTYVGEVDSFKDTCQAIMRTAETKSITELFENTLYIIPCLQRVYEWLPSKEVKTMLDDIRQAYRNEKVGYSLTDILVYNPSFQNSIKKSKGTITYVYDGQQRITTLILILIFLRDVFCFLKGQIEKDALLNSNSDLKDELISMCENGVYEISELLIHNQIVKGEVISESLYQNIVYSDFTQLINYLMKSEGIVFSKEFKEIKENKFIASENVELVSENCTRAINILAYLKDTYSDFKLVLNAKSNAFSLEEKVKYFNYFTKVLLETVMVTVLYAKSEVEATIFYVRKNSRGKAMNPYEGMHCEAQVLNTPDSVRENFSSYIRDFDAKFKKDTSWELTSH